MPSGLRPFACSCDWAVEARNIASSWPFAYGVPVDGATPEAKQATGRH